MATAEAVEITIALHTLVANELIELEPRVVIGLARARATGAAVDAGVHDDVVRAANLVVALVVLAAAVDQKIGGVVVVRTAIVMIQGPDSIVTIDDKITRDGVWNGYGTSRAIISDRVVRRAVPAIEWTCASKQAGRSTDNSE